MLNFQVTFSSQPVCLVSLVSPDDVAPFVRLKIPWRNQNDVSNAYPHSSFHLPAYPAEAFMAVLAAYHKPVAPKHFFGYANHIVTRWHLDGVIVFASDSSFAHEFTPLHSFFIEDHNLNTLVFIFVLSGKLKKFPSLFLDEVY